MNIAVSYPHCVASIKLPANKRNIIGYLWARVCVCMRACRIGYMLVEMNTMLARVILDDSAGSIAVEVQRGNQWLNLSLGRRGVTA